MSVFVDTGVIYAHHDTSARHHNRTVGLFDDLLAGSAGQLYTNEYVLSETITLTHQRTESVEAATTVARRVLGVDPYPAVFEFLYVEPDQFQDAIEVFRTVDDRALRFTDALTIAQCTVYEIDRVLSFNDAFDGVIDRMNPLTGTVEPGGELKPK